MKFTFKKQPRETGLRRVGNPWPAVDIKLGGKRCGFIHPRSWTTPHFSVWFHVESPDGAWRNQEFKDGFGSEQDARDWVTANADEIQRRFKLHFIDAALEGGK